MIVYKCAECGKEFTHRPLWPLQDGGKKAKRSTGLPAKAAEDDEKHISPARCYCSEACRFEAQDKLRKKREAKAYDRAKKIVDASSKDYFKTKKLCKFGGLVAAHRWYAGKYYTACAMDLIIALVLEALIMGQFAPQFIIILLLDIALNVTDYVNLKKGRFTDGKKHPIWPEH